MASLETIREMATILYPEGGEIRYMDYGQEKRTPFDGQITAPLNDPPTTIRRVWDYEVEDAWLEKYPNKMPYEVRRFR